MPCDVATISGRFGTAASICPAVIDETTAPDGNPDWSTSHAPPPRAAEKVPGGERSAARSVGARDDGELRVVGRDCDRRDRIPVEAAVVPDDAVRAQRDPGIGAGRDAVDPERERPDVEVAEPARRVLPGRAVVGARVDSLAIGPGEDVTRVVRIEADRPDPNARSASAPSWRRVSSRDVDPVVGTGDDRARQRRLDREAPDLSRPKARQRPCLGESGLAPPRPARSGLRTRRRARRRTARRRASAFDGVRTGGGRTGVGGVVSAHCRALEWVELRVTAPRGLAPQSGRRPKNNRAVPGFAAARSRYLRTRCQRLSRTTTRSWAFRGRPPRRRSAPPFASSPASITRM